jgi:dTDP-4-amino-4,6-dideoxygalactose transaminase
LKNELKSIEEVLHVGSPNIGNRVKFFEYVNEIFDRRWLTNDGPLVRDFEKRIAEYHDVKHCVAMCNGTIALEIAIRALGLKGEVIVPSFTFVATAHSLSWQGITPVFADIDPTTHNLCPDAVRRMITPRTTGIIGVHLWGRPAQVSELQKIADEQGLKLMFDGAHAFGCTYLGKSIGNFGNCEILSFHATKFFNTFEGGAVLTNDDDLADKMRLMRNFGFSGYDNVIHPGTNGKMIEIVAAMGLVNLESIDEYVKVNYRNYQCYRDGLENIPGISLLQYDESERNNYQYIVIEVDEDCRATRDRIVEALHAENILSRKYFWPGCHNMKPYRELYSQAGLLLPNTQKVSSRVIVLPTGTTMDNQRINKVLDIIKGIIGS